MCVCVWEGKLHHWKWLNDFTAHITANMLLNGGFSFCQCKFNRIILIGWYRTVICDNLFRRLPLRLLSSLRSKSSQRFFVWAATCSLLCFRCSWRQGTFDGCGVWVQRSHNMPHASWCFEVIYTTTPGEMDLLTLLLTVNVNAVLDPFPLFFVTGFCSQDLG